MSKYVAYIPEIDSFLMDGPVPYIDDEKEVRKVITEEVVHPKKYELKPVAFLKAWAKKQEKLEEESANKPYRFSPPNPEFHYGCKEGEKQYLLIVGDENVSKSGTKVKDFDNREEAITIAERSINGLVKEFPNLGYYIFDTRTYGYTDGITGSNKWRVEDFGYGQSEGNAAKEHTVRLVEPKPSKRRKAKPEQPANG
jgi:hypothetical protein